MMRRRELTGGVQGGKNTIFTRILFLRYRVEIIPGLSEPGIAPTPVIQPASRIDKRKMFARSKSAKACYSMPVPVKALLSFFNKNLNLILECIVEKVSYYEEHTGA